MHSKEDMIENNPSQSSSSNNNTNDTHSIAVPEEQQQKGGNEEEHSQQLSVERVIAVGSKGSGEEYDYVEKEIDEDLICSICLLPFIDPISHNSCGNTFCSKCVESVPNCPMCGEGEFKKNCVPSVKMIRNLLDKLKVKCGMCKNIVLRGELKDHQDKYCPLHEAYQQVEQMKMEMKREQEQFVEQNDEFKKKLEQEFQQRMEKLEANHQEVLKQSQERFAELETNLLLKVKQKEELLESNMKERENRILQREKLEMSNNPIHLNVRGQIMTVSLGDFIHNEREPDNLFKKMFTGQHPCYQTSSKKFDDPIYFIDCDPIVFKHILEWLKYGTIGNEISNDMKQSMSNACKTFGLLNLETKLGYNQSNSDASSSNQAVMQMSQFDFMNVVNLARSQKSSLNLTGFDLRKLVISSANLEKSQIIGSDFSGMNLKQTNFKGSNLRGCNFTNCNLTLVNLQECDLENCNFTNAILDKTDFSNSSLLNANLSKVNYLETKFIGCKFESTIGLTDANLSNIDFNQSSFIYCNLENTILNKTNFENSQFNNCKFNNKCKFEGTILRNSSMNNVNGLIGIELIRVDLSGCKLVQTTFTIHNIIDCKLAHSNVQIETIGFKEKLISKCDLSGLNLENIDFTGFKFENVKFNNDISKTNFENVIFENCNIQMNFNSENNLLNSKFIKCDFNGSIFEEIDFKLIKNNLETSEFNNCTFKYLDLKELKDLSKFKGSKFDSCLFNFNQFTNKTIENVQFQYIDLQKEDLSTFTFTNTTFEHVKINPKYLCLFSLIINNCNTSISEQLYSHTKSKSIPQLLYRGSRDGFTTEQFHSKCDNQGPTLTIIKSAEHNQIFGAFTSKSWKSSNSEYVSDSSAFIFKISKDLNENYQFHKFNIKQQQNANCNSTKYLPTFGGGHDFHISNDCNLNNNSNSNFGHSYELPNGYQYRSNEANIYLAGSYNFKVSEIEVFKIIQ